MAAKLEQIQKAEQVSHNEYLAIKENEPENDILESIFTFSSYASRHAAWKDEVAHAKDRYDKVGKAREECHNE